MKSFNVGDKIKFKTLYFKKLGEGIFLQFADDFHYQIEVTESNEQFGVGQKIWIRKWEIIDKE